MHSNQTVFNFHQKHHKAAAGNSQVDLLLSSATAEGFSGGLYVAFPHKGLAKKYFLCLSKGSSPTCKGRIWSQACPLAIPLRCEVSAAACRLQTCMTVEQCVKVTVLLFTALISPSVGSTCIYELPAQNSTMTLQLVAACKLPLKLQFQYLIFCRLTSLLAARSSTRRGELQALSCFRPSACNVAQMRHSTVSNINKQGSFVLWRHSATFVTTSCCIQC